MIGAAAKPGFRGLGPDRSHLKRITKRIVDVTGHAIKIPKGPLETAVSVIARTVGARDPGRRKEMGRLSSQLVAADAWAKRFLKKTFSHIGAARLRSWLLGASVGYLDFSSGWFFDLAGTVDLSVGALSARPDRVRPVIQFPGTYAGSAPQNHASHAGSPDLRVTSRQILKP